MNKNAWLACTDPTEMLDLLRGEVSDYAIHASWQAGWSPGLEDVHGTVTDRKLRLFACGCCCLVWHLITNERSRKAVAVAERFAEGEVPPENLQAIRDALLKKENAATDWGWGAREITKALARPIAWDAARAVAKKAAAATGSAASWDLQKKGATYEAWRAADNVARQAAETVEAALLRDIIGYPFSPSQAAIDPAWRTADVISLAQAAYDERVPNGHLEPDRLAVLSDALEEAGCDSGEILSHLRSPGTRLRGMWSLDLILDKE